MPLILKLNVDGGKKIEVALDGIEKKLKRTSRTTKSFGNILKGVLAARAITTATSKIILAFRSMGSEAIKYNDTLLNMKGITQATSKDMEVLHKSIMKTSNPTEHLGSAVADAALIIAKMGFSAKETSKNLKVVMDLSTASIVESSEAAQVAIQTMKSFNIEGTELERVANVIQTTVSKTSLSFMDYAEAMKFVAPIAAKVNESLEVTSALVGALGNIGLRGSIGGTAIKNMYLNLLKPGEKVNDMLKRMKDEGGTLIDILVKMKDENMSIGDYMNTFNKRALAAALGVGELGDSIAVLLKLLEDEEVKVSEVAEVMRKSFIKQLKITQGLLFNVGNEFITVATKGEVFTESFGDINKELGDFQSWVISNEFLIQEFSRSIMEIASGSLVVLVKSLRFIIEHSNVVITAIKFLGAMKLAGLIISIKSVNKLLKSTKLLGAAAMGPLGWVAIALGSGLVAMKAYVDQVDKIIAKTANLDLSRGTNVDRQISALEKYLIVMDKYKKELKDIQTNYGSSFITSSIKKDKAFKDMTKAGNKIEVEMKLPKNFLDTVLNKEAALKRIKFLKGIFPEDAIDENTKAINKASTFMDTLRAALADAEKKKKAGVAKRSSTKKDPGMLTGWGKDLFVDMERTVRTSFTSKVDLIATDFNGSLRYLIERVKKSADDFNNLGVQKTISKNYMMTPTSLSGTIKRPISPLLGMQKQLSFPGGGVSPISIQISKDFDKMLIDIKKKLAFEQFHINLDIAELDNSKTKELVRHLKDVNNRIKTTKNEIASIEKELDSVNEDIAKFVEGLANGFSTWGNILIDTLGLIGEAQDRNYQREQDALTKRLENLKRERDNAISAHKLQKNSVYLIDRSFRKKEQKLLDEKERREKEYKKRQHEAAIQTAIMNAALAVLSAIATANTIPGKIAAGIAFGVIGAIQVGIVAGAGESRGNTDTVESRVSRVVESRSANLVVNVENLYDDVEHTRNTMEAVFNAREDYGNSNF